MDTDDLRNSLRGKPRYTLEELLAKYDPNAPLSEEDIIWRDLPLVSGEIPD